MPVGRETIYAALFALLQGDPGCSKAFRTITRRLVRPSQLTTGGMPALSMLEQSEEYRRTLLGGPAKVTLSAILRIDAEVQLDSDEPAQVINNLCDLVENALEPLPGATVLTLPGITDTVQHVWLEGRVTVYPANVNVRNSLTLMEVKILVAGPYP